MNEKRVDLNIAALEQAAKQDREHIAKLETELRSAQTQIIDLKMELSTLRVQVITAIAKFNGSGRTA